MSVSQCVDERSDEKGPCSVDGDCLPGLACVADETMAVCQPVCTDSHECGAGRACRGGLLPDERSVCIIPRAEGESCSASIAAGDNICDDGTFPSANPLACVSGACRYVCDWEGDDLPPNDCPGGLECSTVFRTIPGAEARGAICEPPCVPPSDPDFCFSRAVQCGTTTGTDRCGNLRTADCGGCAVGGICNQNRCATSNIPENSTCLDRRGTVVPCASGLDCVVWGEGSDLYGSCKRFCSRDNDCPGSESCVFGILEGSGGLCGHPREQGEWCEGSIRNSSEFCWSFGSPSGSLFDCMGGRCEYVCGLEGIETTYRCPFGQSCDSLYLTYPEYPARARVCLP